MLLTEIWMAELPELRRFKCKTFGSSNVRTKPKSNSSSVEYKPGSETDVTHEKHKSGGVVLHQEINMTVQNTHA